MVKILRENNNGIKQLPTKCIKGATLLSYEELKTLLSQDERKCDYEREPYWWWSRTCDLDKYTSCWDANGVDENGTLYACIMNIDNPEGGIRPALQLLNIKAQGFMVGDQFKFGDYEFKIISNDYALCEEIIGLCAFRRDYDSENAGDYEYSDAKKYVDDWFKRCIQDARDVENGIMSDSMIAAQNDFGF